MTRLRGIPICVSPMAVAALPLAGQLAVFQALATDRIGLAASAVAQEGLRAARASIMASGLSVDYLVLPLLADPRDPAGRDADRRALQAAVEAADALGARLVYTTSGPSAPLPFEEATARLADHLAGVVDRAGELGVALALENTSPVRSDLSFTHTVRDAAEVAAACSVGLCLDLYCCWQEPRLPALITEHLDRIELVQVADLVIGTQTFPNRWVPGDGDLPLGRLLGEVLAAGYRGPIDLELLGPEIDRAGADVALQRGVEWLRGQLGAGPGADGRRRI